MSKACHIAHALVLLSALSTLPAQQPISLSGTLRLANLTVPAALPFTPDPGAPPVFLAAYGDGGSALPASFPSIPTGYNPSHGVDARLTLEGASIDLTTAETIFYVLTDTGFLVSLSDPNLRIRTLTGTWAVFSGSHLAPSGSLRGPFTITITSYVVQARKEGEATGTLSVTEASGDLSGSGALGLVHDLTALPWASQNWLNNLGHPPATGGDILFFAVGPKLRLLPPTTHATTPGSSRVEGGDVDGDGWSDLLVTETLNDRIAFLLNDGGGNLLPGGDLPVGSGPVAARAARLDPDPWPDLIVASAGLPGIELRYGTGVGFGPPTLLPLPGAPSDLEVGDLTGDGRPDLIACVPAGPFAPGMIRIWINDGVGGFGFSLDITNDVVSPARLLLDRSFFVVEADLFVLDMGDFSIGPRVLAFDLGLSGATLLATLPAPGEPRGLSVHDLDRDGQRDILVARFGNPITGLPGGLDVYPGTGPSTWGAPITVYATHALDVATMDWNGNGLPDAILGSYGDLGPVLLQDWNGAGFDSATVEPHGSEAFDVAAVDTGRNGFPAPVALLPSVGLVAIDHTVPAARAEPYGAGCPGTFGVTPRMSTSRLPNLGNGEFVISVLDAYPNVPALLFLSFRRAQTPLPGPPGCDVLVSLDLPWFVIWSGFGALAPGVGPNGAAHVTFHIPGPAQAALFQGLDVYAQWAVLDPGGSVPTSPPLSLSEGLRMIIY